MGVGDGHGEIRTLFEQALAPSELRRELRLEVDDVVTGGDLAVVRTHSTGTVTLLEYGASTDVPYRELFVLRSTGGGWLVTAYMFNSPAVER